MVIGFLIYPSLNILKFLEKFASCIARLNHTMLFKSNFYWSLTFTHLLHLQQSWWALFSRSETVCRVLRPSVVVPVFVAVLFLHGSGRKGLRPESGQVCRREKLAWKYLFLLSHDLNTTGLVWYPSMSEPGKIVCKPVKYMSRKWEVTDNP